MLTLVEGTGHDSITQRMLGFATDDAKRDLPGAYYLTFPSTYSSSSRALRHTLEYSVVLSDEQRVQLITREARHLAEYTTKLQLEGQDTIVVGGIFSYLLCQDTEPTEEEILVIKDLLPAGVRFVFDSQYVNADTKNHPAEDIRFAIPPKSGRQAKWLAKEGNYAIWRARMDKLVALL